jgi:hypothetical protein
MNLSVLRRDISAALLLEGVSRFDISMAGGAVLLWIVYANGLQLPEGGDFEALHCQPSTNFDRSTKLDSTTESPQVSFLTFLLPCNSFTFFDKHYTGCYHPAETKRYNDKAQWNNAGQQPYQPKKSGQSG